MRYIPWMLVVFGSVAVAGAQVRAPELGLIRFGGQVD